MSTTDLELYDDEEAEAADDGPRLAQRAVELQEELAVLRREAEAVIGGEGESAALVPTQQSPVRVKARVAATRSKLVRVQAAMEEKGKELERVMRRQMELVRFQLEPLQATVDRLTEAIWTVNLYLGRDEEILLLRDGDPAAADEPLVIRQLVLSMEEECALMPGDQGIDAGNLPAFDEWLLADPAHLDQVLPERKGVVAIVPRFEAKRGRDQRPHEDDFRTYFLIRSGDRLFRMWTKFDAGKRLVPTASEFTDCFTEERYSYDDGRRGRAMKHRIPVTPGTRAWDKAQELASAKERHYMRVALILQGLIDRTAVFHPLPPAGLSLIDRADHEAGKVRFVADAENLLGTGREPFREWHLRLMKALRPGMRVVGSFDYSLGFSRERYEDRSGHSRLRPPRATYPDSGVLYTIEQDGRELLFRYERTGETIYPGGGWHGHAPKRRASCLVSSGDAWLIPFDLVTVEEMEEYLAARTERHAYVEMFPLLQTAIRLKHEEEAEEAPFRTMLAGVLARDNGVSVDEAAAAVPELVDWWKLANRNHRPLVGDEESQSKAVRMIVKEHRRRLDAKQADAGVVALIRSQEPNAMLVARRRDGGYVAVVPEEIEPFVRLAEFGARGARKAALSGARWRLLAKKQVMAWTEAWRSERFDGWKLDASYREHLSLPEIEALGDEIVRELGGGKLVAVCYDPRRRSFYSWEYERDAQIDDDHPLTRRGTDARGDDPPEVDEDGWSWKRGQGGTPKLTRHSWSSMRPNYTEQRRPWDTRGRAFAQWQGGSEAVNQYRVIYEHPGFIDRWDAEQARYDAARKRQGRLWERVRSIVGGVEAQWLAAAEEREHARFLEDFQDPTLWEGHRKLLKLRYPHHHYRGGTFVEKDALWSALEALVEEGVSVDEVLVSELPGLDVEEVPEDIRSFRVTVAAGEPDEEEEDEGDDDD